MSSRPRDMHQPPKFTALIPREPEAMWVGSRPSSRTRSKNKEGSKVDEEQEKHDEDKEKEEKGRRKTFANGIKSLCIYVPRNAKTQYKNFKLIRFFTFIYFQI